MSDLKKQAYDRLKYLANREARIKEATERKRRNRERTNELANLRNSKNRSFVREQYRSNYEKNKSKHRERVNKYRRENPVKARAWRKNYRSKSPLAKIKNALRCRIATAIKCQATKKHERTRVLIGCTARFFREFIEAQFTGGMSWENYGRLWQIDHVIPVSKFDLSDPIQQRRAFNYSNCRPLDRELNKEKGDSMPGPHQPMLL